MPFLREYAPEVVCIMPGETQVIAVIPEKDAASLASKETAQAILGVTFETVKFEGPAYRPSPKSPLVLYQWILGSKVQSPIIQTEGRPPILCAETRASSAVLSKEWLRLGFTGKAYECRPNDQYLPEGDLCRPQIHVVKYDDIVGGLVYHVRVAVTCTT